MTPILPLVAAATLALAPAPAPAQDAERGDPLFPPPETFEGVADILRETFARLAARLGPWREQLEEVLANPGAYEPPVILPNGDILIRRKPEAAPETPLAEEETPEGSFDL